MTHRTLSSKSSLFVLVGLLAACSGAAGSEGATAGEGGDTGSAADRVEQPGKAHEQGSGAADAPENSGAGGESSGADAPAGNGNQASAGGSGSGSDAPTNGQDAAGAAGQAGSGSAAADGSNSETPASDTGDKKPITPQDWMSAIAGLEKKQLNQLYLPGTHDSGTYRVQSVYERPVDDAFAPDDGGDGTVRLGQFADIAPGWAQAQDQVVYQQLADGIRVLDLRACAEKNGTLRVCHKMYGAQMIEILDHVRAFAANHPQELLVLDISKFSNMGAAEHQQLISDIKNKLGNQLLSYEKKEVSPTTTLGEVWRTGKSVAVIYESDQRDPAFMPASSLSTSWGGDVWKRQATHDRLQNAVPSEPSDTFFWFSAQATPNADLITRSLDPLGNYPKTLEKLAASSNPVALGWAQNEWGKLPLNIIAVDFYQHSCVVPLAQALNGGSVSFDGCSIGQDTDWDKWALAPYGRGAGVPLGCGPGEEQVAGLCYDSCRAGYSSNIGFPYLCQKGCPDGYTDLGLTCTRGAKTVTADTSDCSLIDKCGVFKSCSKCPSGYENDGCLCTRHISTVAKERYERGVGRAIHACPAGTERSGLLCYPSCRSGFHGEGPLCIPD
jgi:hypothetical protein